MEQKLGKIEHVWYGLDDRDRMGCHFTLSFQGEGAQVSVYKEETLCAFLRDAKVRNIAELKNKPIEVTGDTMLVKAWRILTEVL